MMKFTMLKGRMLPTLGVRKGEEGRGRKVWVVVVVWVVPEVKVLLPPPIGLMMMVRLEPGLGVMTWPPPKPVTKEPWVLPGEEKLVVVAAAPAPVLPPLVVVVILVVSLTHPPVFTAGTTGPTGKNCDWKFCTPWNAALFGVSTQAPPIKLYPLTQLVQLPVKLSQAWQFGLTWRQMPWER
jgi:hypothetical protein